MLPSLTPLPFANPTCGRRGQALAMGFAAFATAFQKSNRNAP